MCKWHSCHGICEESVSNTRGDARGNYGSGTLNTPFLIDAWKMGQLGTLDPKSHRNNISWLVALYAAVYRRPSVSVQI